MKKSLGSCMILLLIFVLTACSTEDLEPEKDDVIVLSKNEDSANQKEVDNQNVKTEEIVTMTLEQDIGKGKVLSDVYTFNGFISEDTLSFERLDGYRTYKVYIPAIKGYSFTFKHLEGYQMEIVDFSREEGWVKLKISITES